ncbi:MAG: single-stranded-DNA-specific exonuclease RecJ [Ruminococcaceae bacterium]|nr:single-stranded-DNA-specific exonuclease RecJ [Oscillospiraceae bacterium]
MKIEGAKLNKRWNLLYKNIDPKTVAAIESAATVSPLLALLLAVRDVKPQEAASYIKGGMQYLYDPFLLQDMDKAVNRIQEAIRNNEKICVYGDYDVDGISSVSMLLSYFKQEGVTADFYIPDREKEGYGLNADAIRNIAENGTSLLITVDTGITAIEETDLANSLGMDVIITDHHSVGEVLPCAIAVINPKRPDCNYPFKALAGAGVAFKLLCALCGDTKKAVTDFCDTAALATIADVVSLNGENRIITALGLRKMRKMPSIGFSALLESAGIEAAQLTSYQISFGVAPRLNAAGRMGNCLPAVRLLQTDSIDEASEIAAELDAQNTARKALGDVIYEEAIAAIEDGDYSDKQVIVLAHSGWHHGIIGITASKIAEQYYKSTFLISTDGKIGKGSGRSIPGLNLYEALRSADSLLDRYGGHALAAGLTISVENIEELSAALNAYAESVLTPEDRIPSLDIDAPLDISLPLLQVAHQLETLEPYGAGNPKPVFLISGVTLSSVRTSKDERHLFLRLFKNGAAVDCVAFGKGDLANQLNRGDTVDIAGELHLNTYGGVTTPQIIMQDIRVKN